MPILKNITTAFLPRLAFPTELEFEPIQLCNAMCFTCPYSWLQKEKDYLGKFMPREKIEHLLTDFGELLRKNNYDGMTTVNPFRYSDPLICRHLDLVFTLAKKYSFKVQITTNAVSFTDSNTQLMEEYFDFLRPEIVISIIGSTREEVEKYMEVDLDRTISLLQKVVNRGSILTEKIKISLRVVSGTPQEWDNLLGLQKLFNQMGLKAIINQNWIHNRINGKPKEQSPDSFIKGCDLHRNKLLRRMEVMVNGDVVLCDDDAEGRKIFGNVFVDGIEKIWNGPLFYEHSLIYQKTFSDEKNDLICKNCTRANWEGRKFPIYYSFREVGPTSLSKQLIQKKVTFV